MLGLIGIFSLIFILPFFPLFFKLLNRDAGIFLYIAESILKGALPYKDLWDHKGPVIYYLDALALALGGKYGVWVMHFLLIFFAALFFYKLITLKFKEKKVLILTIFFFFLQVSTIFYEYNQVEFVAFFLQSLYVLLFLREESAKERIFSKHFLLGFLAGISFWLRANLIGFFAAGLFFLFIEGLKRRRLARSLRFIFAQIAGFLSLSIAIIAFFYSQSALQDFFDQVFFYNLVYSRVGMFDRVSVVFDLFEAFRNGKTVFPAMTGLFLFLYLRKKYWDRASVFIFTLLLMESLMVLVSGRSYIHYFYLLVIPFCYFLAIFFAEVNRRFDFSRNLFLYLFLLVYIGFSFFKQSSSKVLVNYSSSVNSPVFQVADLVRSSLGEEDKILVWGAEAQIYSLAQKDSASKYFYQYALFTPGYEKKAVDEFLQEIQESRPVFVIDASFTTAKVVPLDPLRRKYFAIEKNYVIPEKINVFLNMIEKEYVLYQKIGEFGVYKLKN